MPPFLRMTRTAKLLVLTILQGALSVPQLLATSYAQPDHSQYIQYRVHQVQAEEPRRLVTPKKRTEPREVQPKELPTELELPLQFFAQAPHGDWSDPYQNACEEMSLLLAHGFLTGTKYNKETVDTAVVHLTNFVARQGYDESMPMAAVQAVAKEYWGINSHMLENPTERKLKASLAAGYPIIVPLAGQFLGNPHFMGDGPPYHVLVLSGYTETEFITQEVGTNFGQSYRYSIKTIMQNLHDYTGSDETITSGARRALVLLPV